MDEYIGHRKKHSVPVKGYLAVPKKKTCVSNAKSLLTSLFPGGSKISVLAVSINN